MVASYHEKIDIVNKIKLSKHLEHLPSYCADFFRGIEPNTASGTRVAYAYDLQRFFRYLLERNTDFVEINDISLEYIENLSIETFEDYMQYLKYTVKDGLIKLINTNSGIRMSIHRKGGKEVTVYLGEDVHRALLDYLKQRNEICTLPGHEQALFLSMRRSRISISAVENLVKKYSHFVTPLKNITPHKLRSTYGTSLYRVTGDIYLVADVLGHTDVNTTRKHYAAIEEDRRRNARNVVTLRKKILTKLDK